MRLPLAVAGIDPAETVSLVEALEDKSSRVRAEACRSLEDLGATEVTPAVRARLDDMDEDVRIAAMEALEELKGA